MATIVMDAGHGGSDWGATRNGRMEKADNIALTIAIGRELERRGHNVIYTRQTDVFVPLDQRARISNNARADLFVSVHRNASTNSAANGFEILVSPNASAQARACAQSVLNRINALGLFADRGIRTGNFVVLNSTSAPAILVEFGFLSNAQDNARFDQNFSRIAIAAADGINDCVRGVTTPPQVPPTTTGLTGTVSTAGGNLNVRSSPNATAPVIGSLPNGTTISILGEQNGFYQINFSGRTGWVAAPFVRVTGFGTVTTAGGVLNMRSAPSTTASIITTIPNGTRIPITGISGDFFQTNFSGRTGFVSRSFVRT